MPRVPHAVRSHRQPWGDPLLGRMQEAGEAAAAVSSRPRVHPRSLKLKGCTDCGAKPAARELHFHHLDPATKTAGVSKLVGRGRAVIDAEVAKTIVLCRGCHRSRHRSASY